MSEPSPADRGSRSKRRCPRTPTRAPAAQGKLRRPHRKRRQLDRRIQQFPDLAVGVGRHPDRRQDRADALGVGMGGRHGDRLAVRIEGGEHDGPVARNGGNQRPVLTRLGRRLKAQVVGDHTRARRAEAVDHPRVNRPWQGRSPERAGRPAVEPDDYHVGSGPVLAADRQARVEGGQLNPVERPERLERGGRAHREHRDDGKERQAQASLTGSHPSRPGSARSEDRQRGADRDGRVVVDERHRGESLPVPAVASQGATSPSGNPHQHTASRARWNPQVGAPIFDAAGNDDRPDAGLRKPASRAHGEDPVVRDSNSLPRDPHRLGLVFRRCAEAARLPAETTAAGPSPTLAVGRLRLGHASLSRIIDRSGARPGVSARAGGAGHARRQRGNP